MRSNTHAALRVVLAAGSVAGLGAATAPPEQATQAPPIAAINLHNEQGNLSMSWPYWAGGGRCSTRSTTWFRGVGGLAGGSGDSWVWGVSPDGRVAVGMSHSAPLEGMSPALRGMAWTVCGGALPTIGTDSATFGSQVRSASSGGQVIVGSGADQGAEVGCRWFGASGLDLVVDQFEDDPLHTLLTGVSSDGTIICGSAFDAVTSFAFVLVDGGLFAAPVGDLPGGSQWSEAAGISANGVVVVGRSSSAAGMQAFRWTAAEGITGLGDLPGGAFHSEATASSADGAAVVGWSAASAGPLAFRWTLALGMTSLGDLPGGDGFSKALAVSRGGHTVVGTSSSAGGEDAFIWDAMHGMRSLRSVLASDYGLDLTGWTLTSATGISADGRTIVGNGYNPSGQAEGWAVQLPDVCSADWNSDGVVDSVDFFDFLSDFFGLGADFNRDGATDSQDFFDYLGGFYAGC